MVMAMVVATGVLTLLVLLAVFVAHVPVTGAQIAALFLSNVPGVLPFCALGLLLGTLVKGQGAPAVINMLYLPMAFLSGLWFPVTSLPKAMQSIAPALPSFHLNALALDAVDIAQVNPWPHIAILAAFTVGVHSLAYGLIGGLGTALGPLLGVLIDIGVLESIHFFAGYRMIIFGGLVAVLLIVRPRGLLDETLVHRIGYMWSRLFVRPPPARNGASREPV